MDRGQEVERATRRLQLEERRGRILARVLPVAALFLRKLDSAAAGEISPASFLFDPPRSTASDACLSLEQRALPVERASIEVLDLLAATTPLVELARARIRLSAAVLRARPLPAFWSEASAELGQVVARIAVHRDRALVEHLARNRGGSTVRWAAGKAADPVPLDRDDIEVLAAVRRRADALLARIETIRRLFVVSNLRLVSSIARKRFRLYGGPDLEDLEQGGNMGLLKAVDRFDPSRGFKFSTYASWWIKQSISRCQLEGRSDIRLPVHMFELISKVRQVRDHWLKTRRSFPTDEDVAQELSVTVDDVRRARRAPTQLTSLETEVGLDNGGRVDTLGERIPDPDAEDPDREYRRAEFEAACTEVFARFLSHEEAAALRRRLGSLGGGGARPRVRSQPRASRRREAQREFGGAGASPSISKGHPAG